MDERSGGVGEESEALSGHASTPPPKALRVEIGKKHTRPELNALAHDAYFSGDPQLLADLGNLTPSEKYYLATRPEFKEFIVAMMFDGILGNEKVNKAQRDAASWFFRAITANEKKKEEKPRTIPEDATVIDAGSNE